jgi:hypothetical protein
MNFRGGQCLVLFRCLDDGAVASCRRFGRFLAASVFEPSLFRKVYGDRLPSWFLDFTTVLVDRGRGLEEIVAAAMREGGRGY